MMDKQNVVRRVLEKIAEMREQIQENLAANKKAAAEAPGAMQSHSDTSKFQFGKLAEADTKRLYELDAVLEKVRGLGAGLHEVIERGALATVKERGALSCIFFVPEGIGGLNVDADGANVQSVSESSPVGKMLAGKRKGEVARGVIAGREREVEIVDVK